jgi:hypothetical protein
MVNTEMSEAERDALGALRIGVKTWRLAKHFAPLVAVGVGATHRHWWDVLTGWLGFSGN